MRLPQRPQITNPCSKAGPSRGGAVATIFSMRLAIRTHLCEIGFILLPREVSNMRLTYEKEPLLLGKRLDVERAISMPGGMGPSVTEGSPIARIAQHFEHGVVLQRHPMDLASMSTRADTAREEQPLVRDAYLTVAQADPVRLK